MLWSMVLMSCGVKGMYCSVWENRDIRQELMRLALMLIGVVFLYVLMVLTNLLRGPWKMRSGWIGTVRVMPR
jgi:hypothetical protein